MFDRTEVIEGIVVNIYEQPADESAIIKIFTQNEIIWLKAKGFCKPQSKNKTNISIGSLVNFEIFVNYHSHNQKQFLLKKATKQIPFIFDGLEDHLFYKRLFYVFQKIEKVNKDLFDLYKHFLLDDNKEFKLWFVTFFYYQILVLKNKKLNLNYCVVCKSNQQLYAFSWLDGGMICFLDYSNQKNNWEKTINFNLSFIKSIYALGLSVKKYIETTNSKTNKEIFFMLKDLDEY